MIQDPRELYRFFAKPGIEVVNLMFVSVDVVWASWKFAAEGMISSSRHRNEVIGAYVTTGVYIHLYG
jgi:hypothetical protein